MEGLAASTAAVREVLAKPKPWDLAWAGRELCRQLKIVQQSLQQDKALPVEAAAELATICQRLLSFGLDEDAVPQQPHIHSTPTSPTKYIPPAARSTAPSSDSEASDAELGSSNGGGGGGGSGGGYGKAGRVRFLSLACMQLMIKKDPKSFHPRWVSLLPDSDIMPRGTPPPATLTFTLAHSLLLDPSPRVRHSAAATIALFLEGPAQRAYLAISECKTLGAQPVRGFVPLSATLGHLVVGTHLCLMRSLGSEQDTSALSAALRALGTLVVGSPYPRLPPELLPRVVLSVRTVLRNQTIQQPAIDTGAPLQEQMLISACLTCLAGAFGTKPASPSLAVCLAQDMSQEPEGGIARDLLRYAGAQGSPGVQLDAFVALRGLAQQYCAAIEMFWEEILCIGSKSAALTTVPAAVPLEGGEDVKPQKEGSLAEKAGQQGVLLTGDALRGSSGASVIANENDNENGIKNRLLAKSWEKAVTVCFAPCLEHTSPLLRTAGFASLAGLKQKDLENTILPSEMRSSLLRSACAAVVSDLASPVRSAAAKALTSLFPHPDNTLDLQLAVPALVAACTDSVLAVRVQAAGSLASIAESLRDYINADITYSSSNDTAPSGEAEVSRKNVSSLAVALFPTAVQAAGDHDKVRADGVRALGALFACLNNTGEVQEDMLSATVDAVVGCLRCANVKVQWSACVAAGTVFAVCRAAPSGAPGGSPERLAPLISALEQLSVSSENSKTRTLAAECIELAARGSV